ncbi:RHS repeat domain-containing protein [Pseudomonas sp. TMB3-21]
MNRDSNTPCLTVIDGRGLPVRQIAYWRHSVEAEALITQQHHDACGWLVAKRDPRLMTDASARASLAIFYSLSGQVLSTLSVDAGWRASLLGEANQLVHGWDGRGSHRRIEYDDQARLLAVFDQAADSEQLCAERYGYGASDPVFALNNQCGQLIRHDDPAGTQLFTLFGMSGGVSEQTRHFLRALSSPDWPALVTERDALLETGAGAISRSVFNALGEAVVKTDARGNHQFFSHTRDGQLHEVRLQLDKDSAPKTLVRAIQYNAQGLTERETSGNGVVTTLHHAAEDSRLTRLQSQRGNDVLQDLRYTYDPVGNVLSIEDAALPTRYFANRRIEPISRYVYDSLYQLIEATGWETGGPNQGPRFSSFNDPAACAHYTQTYRYDRAGNLLELTHEGPQNHGHRLLAAAQSNRCLPVVNGVEPDENEFRKGFDDNGNLLSLQPGQSLYWNLRNQFREVRPVERDPGADDSERYVYGADGMRLRKVRSTQSHARTLTAEVRYLPNLQIRTHSGTGEVLQVISVQAGRSSVQVLHWESEPPKDIVHDQQRYSLSDHLGSCTLELDGAGQMISHERYHPFGTTSWFAGRGEVEASYKTLRYSGKERDATGLYYYGFRYYVAWWQRWLNPDPIGSVDGLNVFSMVRNNPLTYFDSDGRVREEFNNHDPIAESSGSLSSLFLETQIPTTATNADSHPSIPPDTFRSAAEGTSKNQPIDGLMKKPQLTPADSFISITDDIGGRPPIAGGGEGAIYESSDGKFVYKKFISFDRKNSIPGSVAYEGEMFNQYYGDGSATALLEDNQVYLKMIKLDGIPLDDIEKGSIPAHSADALKKMFTKMEKKDLYHQDVKGKNFLYSEKDKIVYPVDMAAQPYEFAQYTIDIYERNKKELLTEFSRNVKR